MKTVIAIMALLISTSAVAGLPGSPVLRGRPNLQPAGVPGSPIFGDCNPSEITQGLPVGGIAPAGVPRIGDRPCLPADLTGEEQAIIAFSNDALVSESISELQADSQFTQVKEAKAMQIGVSCGFAGCTNKYLVSQMLTSGQVNTQSAVVLAVVTIGVGGVKVTLTNIQE